MRAFALLLSLLLASPAAAQESALRTLTTADDTKGWEAVGRLNLGTRGFCTGALIAPHLVLTAAHCLYDRDTGVAVDPAEIEFLAGWRNGRAAAYRHVRRAVPHPEFRYSAGDRSDRVAYDLALLELDQPIRLPSIRPFETDARPAKGEPVGVVSYAFDRSEAPSLQELCHVLARQVEVLVLSCSVDFGSSGAPVFAMKDGVARIVSVVSAKAEIDSRIVALGSTLDAPLETLRAALDAGTGLTSGAAPTVRRIGVDAGRGTGGAKFVRP